MNLKLDKHNESYEKFNVSQKAVIIRDDKCFIAEINILATYDCSTLTSLAGAAVYGTVSLVHTDEEIVLSDEHIRGN